MTTGRVIVDRSVECQPVALLAPCGTGDGPPGLVAVPSREWLWAAAVPPLVALLHAAPVGSRFLFSCLETTIAAKRNAAVRELLDQPDLRWLLFLDADMTPPADALARLLAWNVPVVSATCVRRSPPYDVSWIGSGGAQPGSDRLPAVYEVGAGFLLIQRHVLEAVSPPWFVANDEGVAEDIAFSRKARAAGVPVYLDRTLRVGHLAVQSLVGSAGED